MEKQVLLEQYDEVSNCLMDLMSDAMLLDLLDRSPWVSAFPADVRDWSRSRLLDFLVAQSYDLSVELSHLWEMIEK